MRIVVFIGESIRQQSRAFFKKIYQFLLYSFTFSEAKSTHSQLLFVEDEEALGGLVEKKDMVVLTHEKAVIAQGSDTFFIAELELVPAFLESLEPIATKDLWVIIMRPSLWISRWEKEVSLWDKWYILERNLLFKSVIIKSVKIASKYAINLAVVDSEACIGYKNSAFIKRLFYKRNQC